MDQHSQQIPGLDRYSRKVSGVISGLSRREKPDLYQPIQMLGLDHNSQRRMASDIAPGLLLLARRDDTQTDFMYFQQIPGLAPNPRKIPRLPKTLPTKLPGQHAHQGVTSDMASGVSCGGKELMDQRLQEVPRHEDMMPALPYSQGRSSILWRTELLISEEELRHAIDVFLKQPLEDIETLWRISAYIFDVVLPHTSNSRKIYDSLTGCA
ncbi:hypothetical protein B0H14DRAFT_3556356 [Mycena olivaceomarginata]|nr:hypothetical protein B0H14DRAFT_3556356 [Mycena olivaceomarginata]